MLIEIDCTPILKRRVNLSICNDTEIRKANDINY
jgi:hypothetical protein